MMMNIDRVLLRNHLLTVFNNKELQVLANRVGIGFDQLGGQSIADKAGSLIGFVDRNGRLSELILEMIKERPHLELFYASHLAQFRQKPHPEEDLLARWAAGEGEIIEEPPTMRWDNDDD